MPALGIYTEPNKACIKLPCSVLSIGAPEPKACLEHNSASCLVLQIRNTNTVGTPVYASRGHLHHRQSPSKVAECFVCEIFWPGKLTRGGKRLESGRRTNLRHRRRRLWNGRWYKEECQRPKHRSPAPQCQHVPFYTAVHSSPVITGRSGSEVHLRGPLFHIWTYRGRRGGTKV